MNEDDQHESHPNPGDKKPYPPDISKSVLARVLAEQLTKRLRELGVPETTVVQIRPAEWTNIFTGHTVLEIGQSLEAAKRLLEAEGHQVVFILDEMDDEREAKEL